MSTTIPGGAYQDAGGAWHNANGEPLKPEQVAQFEKIARAHQQNLAELDQQQFALEARNNPVAQALLGAFRPAQRAEPEPPPSRLRGARGAQTPPPSGNDPPPEE